MSSKYIFQRGQEAIKDRISQNTLSSVTQELTELMAIVWPYVNTYFLTGDKTNNERDKTSRLQIAWVLEEDKGVESRQLTLENNGLFIVQYYQQSFLKISVHFTLFIKNNLCENNKIMINQIHSFVQIIDMTQMVTIHNAIYQQETPPLSLSLNSFGTKII